MRRHHVCLGWQIDQMRLEEIDPLIRIIASQRRKELEGRFQRVRRKRLKRGIPVSQAWVENWHDYIDRAVASYVSKLTK